MSALEGVDSVFHVLCQCPYVTVVEEDTGNVGTEGSHLIWILLYLLLKMFLSVLGASMASIFRLLMSLSVSSRLPRSLKDFHFSPSSLDILNSYVLVSFT